MPNNPYKGIDRRPLTTHITAKQSAYIARRLEHPEESKATSIVAAGYAPGTTPTTVERAAHGEVGNQLAKALRRRGVGSLFLASKIKSLINAKQIDYYTYKGQVTDQRERDDNLTQMRATELVVDVCGWRQPSGGQTQINLGLIEIPTTSTTSEQWSNGGQADAADAVAEGNSQNNAQLT